MRYTNGWVARESLTNFQGLSFLGGQDMEARGFYIIADKFFEDFPDPYLKGNKSESRPHYYCWIFIILDLIGGISKYQPQEENKGNEAL